MAGATTISTLLKNIQIYGATDSCDLRIEGAMITAIGANLPAMVGETRIEAAGAALLPGLHDHHLHMVALAAALDSVSCGPPTINTAAELATTLTRCNQEAATTWLRGIGYHDCVAGDIDRHWLDRVIPDRPARIQHRGGRLWVLNSAALHELNLTNSGVNHPAGLEIKYGQLTGRLYEEDRWLRTRLNSQLPGLDKASRLLASYGVTGITDTTVHNGTAEWHYFQQSQNLGELRQNVRMMGTHELQDCRNTERLQRGEFKIHLLESQLPDFDTLCHDIRATHATGRNVAIHCVTLTELVFTLSALESAGVLAGDRIEHASITPPQQLQQILELGLRVVTQPHFIAERGDQYVQAVEPDEQAWLYRCRGFIENGIPLAGGSDAPFGLADPWLAMQAAVSRKTPQGVVIGQHETLTAEQALALFLYRPELPGLAIPAIAEGSPANLCLLKRPWQQARLALRSANVRMTWRDGELIYAA